MNWNLIRKNLRVERTPLLATIIVSVLCYVAVPAVAFFADHGASVADRLMNLQSVQRVGQLFVVATTLSFFTTCLMLPTLSGNALATERQERWAEFEFMLPVSRTRRTSVRLGVAAGLAAAAFAVQAGLFEAAYHVSVWLDATALRTAHVNEAFIDQHHLDARAQWTQAMAGLACGTLAGFGVGWLATALLPTAALATAVALGASLGLTLVMLVIPQAYSEMNRSWPDLLRTYDAVMLPVGLAGMIGGTVVMLKRRTPVS